MSTSSPNAALPLSPLPGEVCAQYIRCGKPGCHCRLGERHGPYYYRIWREGSRVQKAYVRREDLDAVQAACDAYRAYQQTLRGLRLQREALTQSIRHEWRRAKRLRAE